MIRNNSNVSSHSETDASTMSTPSPRSSIIDFGDLELGSQKSETLRDQSKRFSDLLVAKTELYLFDRQNPIPSMLESPEEKELSGFKYWVHEVATAKEHGGDYYQRSMTALRASLGAFMIFAVLIFSQQQILGCVWIGNIFMHTNIKDSLGASYTSIIGFGRSVILTSVCSWPVSYFLSVLSPAQASILLPFVVFTMSFIIMSCPQLTSRNLMILVMYIVVATPVREDIFWWEPFGWIATYLIALIVALIVNLLPVPNHALQLTHQLLKRLRKDLTMLLLESKTYSDNISRSPDISRCAIASIELLHTRICLTVGKLKDNLPAAKTELNNICKINAANDLSEWVTQSEKLLRPLRMLRNSLTNRVLGEEYSVYSPCLRDAKQVINDKVAPARDRLVEAMIAALGVCDAWADPSAHRTVLPDVQGELRVAIAECRAAFHLAMIKATEKLKEKSQQSNAPIFAHLTRRMSAFSALFDLGDSLLVYLEKHSWEAEELFDLEDKTNPLPCANIISGWAQLFGFLGAEWLWNKQDTFRLALKTSVGMALASLFVSIPYLWDISTPFGVWPGLTVASVNLGKTGSSFHKAADRMFGTLLAAAYALLVTDLFPGNKDYVKIPAITFFTFIIVYLRNPGHEYKYTYAATSIGSMLYGSIKNDFNIAGYIPKRIELIFVGVCIFSMTELLLFPRSSRKMIESNGFEFFFAMKDFMKQAFICARRIEEFVSNSDMSSRYTDSLLGETEDPFQLKRLAENHKVLKSLSTKLSQEIESGLEEPNVGLSLALHPESFRGLVSEQMNCELQAGMLVNALGKLAGYCQEDGHPIREANWPRIHTQFLEEVSESLDHICDWLQAVYPDRRFRAQKGNSVKSVNAAASFRSLEEVRLCTIAIWSDNYSQFVHQRGFDCSDPTATITLGTTTTFILNLCNHLQNAGKCVEEISYRFPPMRYISKNN